MLKRYSTKDMQKVWSKENKLKNWLKIEILTIEAFTKKNIIPKNIPNKIKNKAIINISLMEKLEEETKHDMIAFTRMISQSLGEEKKWVHFGLTSTDVVDTGYAIQYKQANSLITKQLELLSCTLKSLAIKYAYTPCIGRTHGVHAEITSLGLKFALWFDEIERQKERFAFAKKGVEQGKISGAVGNFANTKPYVQDYVCKKLKINSANISTQILQRDNHAFYFSTIAIIGSSLEKFATTIRLLQKTEIREVFEKFSKNQKGSSAMPHKQNPISSENICGQARLLRSYAQSALENNNLWHERDISHSSVERIIAPDATATLEYSLKRFNNILQSLIIDKKQIHKNIWLTNGVIFSQRVMLYLITNKKLSREKAYDIIQPLAKYAFDNNLSFKKELTISKKIKLSKEELDNLFDVDFYLKEVNTILKRVKIK